MGEKLHPSAPASCSDDPPRPSRTLRLDSVAAVAQVGRTLWRMRIGVNAKIPAANDSKSPQGVAECTV